MNRISSNCTINNSKHTKQYFQSASGSAAAMFVVLQNLLQDCSFWGENFQESSRLNSVPRGIKSQNINRDQQMMEIVCVPSNIHQFGEIAGVFSCKEPFPVKDGQGKTVIWGDLLFFSTRRLLVSSLQVLPLSLFSSRYLPQGLLSISEVWLYKCDLFITPYTVCVYKSSIETHSHTACVWLSKLSGRRRRPGRCLWNRRTLVIIGSPDGCRSATPPTQRKHTLMQVHSDLRPLEAD